MNPKISIISAAFHSEEWEQILRKTIDKYTGSSYEVLIHNNSENNIGHAEALNKLLPKCKGDFILAIDIDAHIVLQNWDIELINLYKKTNKCGMICAVGNALKPISPSAMFFSRELIKNINLDFNPLRIGSIGNQYTVINPPQKNLKYDLVLDVGIFAYFKTLFLGYTVLTLDKGTSIYKNTLGTTYYLENSPIFYHNWYGTRFFMHDKVDNISLEEYSVKKDSLFTQLKNKNIL